MSQLPPTAWARVRMLCSPMPLPKPCPACSGTGLLAWIQTRSDSCSRRKLRVLPGACLAWLTSSSRTVRCAAVCTAAGMDSGCGTEYSSSISSEASATSCGTSVSRAASAGVPACSMRTISLISSSPVTLSRRMAASGSLPGAAASAAPESRAMEESRAESTSCISRASAVRSEIRAAWCSALSRSARASAAAASAAERSACEAERSWAVRTFCAHSIGVNRMKPVRNRLSTTCCARCVASQASTAISSDTRHMSVNEIRRNVNPPSRKTLKTASKAMKYPAMLPNASNPSPEPVITSTAGSSQRLRSRTAPKPSSSTGNQSQPGSPESGGFTTPKACSTAASSRYIPAVSGSSWPLPIRRINVVMIPACPIRRATRHPP
ncbi:hypothetical protein ATC04_14520 [Arthrobacter sp. YC-RL1]|nr:hypothetical protein ATC04_14520 [Arthrobacter sp. YC-RL1]